MLSYRCLYVCMSVLSYDVGVLWPNGCMDEDETCHASRPRPWPHCVRWEPSSPASKGHCPQFLAHICCGQMAVWIKMALRGGPRSRQHCARWGPSSSSPNRGHSPPPIFGPFLLWPNGWMDQDVTWYGGRPWPRRRCVGWGPSSP